MGFHDCSGKVLGVLLYDTGSQYVPSTSCASYILIVSVFILLHFTVAFQKKINRVFIRFFYRKS